MEFKKHKILSLLLAAVMLLTALPAAAFAADDAEHNHDEAGLNSVYEIENDAEVIELSSTSGTIGESSVTWSFDRASGQLMIGGNGGCAAFNSADDQPWADIRSEITEVWFSDMGSLAIENLAHWFEGCDSLRIVEIPYTTVAIGERAFAECAALECVMFYYAEEPFSIEESAFYVDTLTALEVLFIPSSETTMNTLYTYDWSKDNRAAYFSNVYNVATLATGYCSCCEGTYSYTLDYEQWTATIHSVRHWCSNCGYDQLGGVLSGSHSYDNSGSCTKCGYYNSAYDNSVCYHTSTRISWSECDWYEYCRSCGDLVDYGTSHGMYVYGDWEYYSSSHHRRYYYCSDCDEGSYSYGYHSASTEYSSANSAQHTVSQYCSTCATTISSSTENHSFVYGSWDSYSDDQHRRMKTCSICEYSTYEYADHSVDYGVWGIYSDMQHRRSESCSCGYSIYNYGNHTDNDDNYYCDSCSYEMTRFSVTVPANLMLTVSANGEVYAPTNAAIVNNSTGDVVIKSISVTTANGWKLVPYGYNMAQNKVNSKLIGFAVNGAKTTKIGSNEVLALSGNWKISKGATLPLNYDAVVSATSTPINQKVLTIVFVVEWA